VGNSAPPTPVEETGVDIAQAFLELSTSLQVAGTQSRLTVTGGRRLISFGAGRLIAPRYGPNVVQAFDGGFGRLSVGNKGTIEAFYAHPVAQGLEDFDDRTGRPSLWGLYGVRPNIKIFRGQSALDVYYIGYREAEARFDQGRDDEERHTVGARVAGSADGWDWDWEAMYQFGSFGKGDISAWSIGTRTGYSWTNLTFKPRLMLEANLITGDADPADPDLQTFNALFPNGNFFGELTPIGPYNLITIGPTATAKIGEDVEVEVQTLLHWRESLHDGIYNVPGNLVRSAGASRARRIGTQGSVSITWAPSRTFDLVASYGFFDAGAFLEETGPSETTHFTGLQARFRY
jgi:hypothetical protein